MNIYTINVYIFSSIVPSYVINMLYYTSIHVRFGVEKLRVQNSPGPRPPNPFFPRQLRRS